MQNGEIRSKLDAFIRKYYLNQLLRGTIIGLSLLLGVFLFLNLTEYYGHFGTLSRAILFWGFWIVCAFVLYQWIIKPLLGLYRLGNIISYQTASVIIGQHFGNIKDKLTNLLQLEEMSVNTDSQLLLAGIEQKTRELRPIAFSGAINLRANQRYLRFLIVPLLLLGIILIFQSNIIFDGTKRIVNYNRFYKQKAPFEFLLLNKNLSTERGADFVLQLAIKGKSVPEEVNLNYLGQQIKMTTDEKGNFIYTLHNLTESQKFNFTAAGFESNEYFLTVAPNPTITGAEAIIYFPPYTGRGSEILPNASDFFIPEGSEIEWKFQTRDADQLVLENGDKTEIISNQNKLGKFQIKRKFYSNAAYKLLLKTGKYQSQDTLHYKIQVIKDQAPGVYADKTDDSLNIKQFYVLGNATDDYGISRITFNYRFINSEDGGKMAQKNRSVPLQTEGSKTDVSFFYIINMDALGMAPSDEIEYYIEAWDNDGIHGAKSTRTLPQKLRRQGLEEVRKNAQQTAGNVKSMMSEAFKESKDLQKQNAEMQDRLNREKGMNWEDKNHIEDLLQKQKKFQEKLEKIEKEKDKLKQEQEEFHSKQNEELKEKQKQMDELFKQMQDPEMKKLMDEIQKLLEKRGSKEELNEKLEQMQKKNQEWNKTLEQLMEQYKQLQLEQKLNDNIDRLQKLAEKENKLAEKTQNAKNAENPQLKEEQKQLNEELNKIKEDLKDAQKMNQDMEKPMNLDMAEPEQQKASEEMQDAEKNLDKNKNKKAGEEQKDAAEQLKKAADKIKDKLQEEESKRLSEDYEKIRQLLENLVDASFKQEEIFTELGKIREYNPRYIELSRRQMAIKEDAAMIEDSLRALAKRQPSVSTFITKEISRINNNMQYALESLNVRRVNEASMREQYVMTGLNNLAVMLMESMENMQQQMSQKKKGSGSCKKPGGNGNKSGESKPKPGDKLSKGQQQLGQMLQELQKKAQQQRQGQQGEGKSGQGKDGGKEGQKQLNKEYARLALMQEALRRELNALRKRLESEGKEGQGLSKELQKTQELMEEQERNLVNKKITPQMLERQKEIETRMLEHEKADRNQRMDDQRQANEPPKYAPTLPPELQLFLKEKQRERELLRKSPIELNPYYRDKSRAYLMKVQ
jgi:flagellar biosynthesis GTPase FlhF